MLGFEYPNPFPPRECNAKKSKKTKKKASLHQTIYFQLAGNKIANNTFENNGTHGSNKYNSQITLQGGFFPLQEIHV